MSNSPQIPVQEIELIPHPLDAWRMVLNALIAVAPGTPADITVHLKEARENALVFLDRGAATPGEALMIDRLMLIGAGKLVGQQLNKQRAAGSPHPADHLTTSAKRVRLHPKVHSTVARAAVPVAAQGEQSLPLQLLQQGEATLEKARSPEPTAFLPHRS